MATSRHSNDDLAALYQAGDDGALLKLIRSNGGLVRRALRRYRAPIEILGLELDDLKQTAAVAIVEGTRRYQPGRSTWALWIYLQVCGAILQTVRAELRARGGAHDPRTGSVTMPVAMSLQGPATGYEGAPVLADVVPGGTRPDDAVVDLDALADVVAAEIEARYRIPGNRRKAARDIWGPQEENQ